MDDFDCCYEPYEDDLQSWEEEQVFQDTIIDRENELDEEDRYDYDELDEEEEET